MTTSRAASANATESIPWQLRKGRNTLMKLEVVREALQEASDVSSVLDIGCNAGVIARGLGESGFFCVGIDKSVDAQGIASPLKRACLGEVNFDADLVHKLPTFDAALLLSVHHHFFRELGGEETARLIADLAGKIRHVILIEVSSKSKEYGFPPRALFNDGDEASVTAFTQEWLERTLPGWNVAYIWKNARRPKLSDRYLFRCRRRLHVASSASRPLSWLRSMQARVLRRRA